LIAHVSAIFLLPVFEKSVIFIDFRAIAHSISAREGGNTVWCKAMARKRTVDDSVTYWFPWKHPVARLRGLEFGVFDQTPPKMGSPARPYGPRLWSVANAPGATFSPFRCPPRGLGRAALDSDHARCVFYVFYIALSCLFYSYSVLCLCYGFVPEIKLD